MATKIPAKVSGSFPAPSALISAFTGGTQTPAAAAASTNTNGQSTLQQYLNYLRSNMGRIDPTQIGNEAQGEINAQTAPILKGYEAQQTQGLQAIKGYTDTLATRLGALAPQVAAGYQTAETQQNAVDQAIQAELAGNGGAQAAALTATLAGRGQATSPGAQAASNATGAAGAAYATGSASLSQLLSQGAAANAYQTGQPGIAALSGLQAAGALQSNIGSAESQAVSDAQKQYPTLVNQLTGQAQNAQKTNLSVAAAGLTASNNADKNAIAAQKNQTAAQLAEVANQIRQQTADTSAYKAQATAAHQTNQDKTAAENVGVRQQQNQIADALKSKQITDAEAKQAQAYAVQLQKLKISNATVAIRAAQTKQKLANGGYTPTQISRFNGTALSIAQGARIGGQYDATGAAVQNGGYNASKQPAPPLTYQQAILEIEQQGVPLDTAISAANRFFAPGDQGRPATVAQKNRIKVGVKKTAKVVGFGG